MKLESEQKIIYNFFSNAIQKNKLSHAYLIFGQSEQYIKSIAFLLSSSLVCDNLQPLACGKCDTCKNIANNKYEDLIFLDGSENQIKKEDIDYIFEKFSSFASKNNKSICILHLIENMTSESANSFLKFLEEPPENCYIFLTTTNIQKILKTIVSRCQRLNINQTSEDIIFNYCLENKINHQNAELLSSICKNTQDVKNIYNSEFEDIKNKCFIFLNCIVNKQDVVFITNFTISKIIKHKQQLILFFDIIIAFLRNVLYLKNNQKIHLQTYHKIIYKLEQRIKTENIYRFIEEIEVLKKDINININLINILEHLAIFITKNNIINNINKYE